SPRRNGKASAKSLRSIGLGRRRGALAGGKRELDDGAGLAGVRHDDRAAVQLDRELAEREPETGSAAAATLPLVKAIEDVRSIISADPRAGIPHPHDDGAFERLVTCAFHTDAPAARGVLHRVGEKV